MQTNHKLKRSVSIQVGQWHEMCHCTILEAFIEKSSLWTGIKRTQSLRRSRLIGFYFSLWSGGRSMASCPMSCCKFSRNNHRGAMQASSFESQRHKILKLQELEKQINSSNCISDNFPPRYLSLFSSIPSIFCCTVVLTCR